MKPIVATALLFLAQALLTEAAVIRLDFGTPTSPVTSGYTAVTAGQLTITPVVTAPDIDGTGISFSITNIGAFTFDNAAQPLNTDGFYTIGNEANPHNFTLTGLTPGDQVTLYAIAAWDGNGRGAQVDFGGSLVQAQIVGSPGTSPTLGNFTLIGTATADSNGIVTGSIFGAHFPDNAATEGQVGAFVFDIQPNNSIPEPATASLAALFSLACLGIRRRRPRD